MAEWHLVKTMWTVMIFFVMNKGELLWENILEQMDFVERQM